MTSNHAQPIGVPVSSADSVPPAAADGPAGSRDFIDVALVVLWRGCREGNPTGVEVLVARRHADAVRGGLWEYPGGKIDTNESPRDAAVRELREETGIAAEGLDAPPEPLARVEEWDATARRERGVRLHAFLAPARATATPRAIGAAEVRWVSLEALATLEFPKGNRAINAALLERFSASHLSGGEAPAT